MKKGIFFLLCGVLILGISFNNSTLFKTSNSLKEVKLLTQSDFENISLKWN